VLNDFPAGLTLSSVEKALPSANIELLLVAGPLHQGVCNKLADWTVSM